MNLKDEAAWNEWVKNNQDPYGGACVKVARRVMEILDEGKDFDTWDIVNRADKETKAGGITGFMAGAVAQMVSVCHVRGEEFRRKWNKDNQISDEGDRANDEEGAILNPALLQVGPKT